MLASTASGSVKVFDIVCFFFLLPIIPNFVDARRKINFRSWCQCPFLAPVILLCVTQGVAACSWGCLHQAFPKMSVGDLPAGPPAWMGWANGVWASKAAGHCCFKGQRLHGTGGVRAVVILLWGQERLWRVASRWRCVYVKMAPPLPCSSFLGLPWGLASPCGLWAALFIIIVSDGDFCATHEWGIGDMRARSGRRLWERSSATGCAGLWSGGHWAVWAVTLKEKYTSTIIILADLGPLLSIYIPSKCDLPQ